MHINSVECKFECKKANKSAAITGGSATERWTQIAGFMADYVEREFLIVMSLDSSLRSASVYGRNDF